MGPERESEPKRSRRRTNHVQRIFEATLTNNVQELKTALQHFYHRHTPSRYIHPPSLPSGPLYSPFLPICRGHRHPCSHDYLRYRYRPQQERRSAPSCRRAARQCQRTELRHLSSIVSQVISSGTAKESVKHAFEKLQKYALDNLVSQPPSPEPSPPSWEQYEGTPLHLAAALGMEPVLKALLRKGDLVHGMSERDSLDHTPLSAAVVSQKVGVIRLVLKKTLSLSRQLHQDVLKEVINDALKVAIAEGGLETVEEILKEREAWKLVLWTSEMLCGPVTRRRLPMVQLLLCSGFSVRHGGASSFLASNPLHLAVYQYRTGSREEVEIVRCLLQHGADPHQLCIIQGPTPIIASALHIAVMPFPDAPCPEIVQLLLEHKADPNVRNGQIGDSPLFWMRPGVSANTLKTLQLLLQFGADPWLTIHIRHSCLTSLMTMHRDDDHALLLFVRVFLDHDPGLVHAKDQWGRTLLYYVVSKPRLFWFLLSRGANPDHVDDDGDSVMDHLLTMQSTVPELTQRCLTLLMCAKVKASFRRSRNCIVLLPYIHPSNEPDVKDCICQAQNLQETMMTILFEVGYLTANDHFQHFLRATNSDSPDHMKDGLKTLAHNPSSLASTCRRVIVNSSGQNSRSKQLLKSIPQLLPGPVKKYLQFFDLVKLVAATLGKSVEEIQDMCSPMVPDVASRSVCLDSLS